MCTHTHTHTRRHTHRHTHGHTVTWIAADGFEWGLDRNLGDRGVGPTEAVDHGSRYCLGFRGFLLKLQHECYAQVRAPVIGGVYQEIY